MKNSFSIIVLVIFTAISAFADGFPGPSPATQLAVNAGTDPKTFVSPLTLAGRLSNSTNGVSVATNAPDGSALSGQAFQFSGLSLVGRGTQNPAIGLGAVGSWEETEVRDPSVWFNGTTYWTVYVGHDSTGGNAKGGVAFSTDGNTWTKGAGNPVINSNSLSSATWFSGNIISPCALFNPLTGETWFLVGGTTNNNSQAYQIGTYVFGLMHLAAGASPTNPANYVWFNVNGGATNPVITVTQPWESTNLYAPDMMWNNLTDMTNGIATVYYNSVTNTVRQTGGGRITLPTLQSDVVTISKFTSNPLMGGKNLQSEEPCIFPLTGGGWVNICGGDVSGVTKAFPVYYTPSPSGQSNWVMTENFSVQNPLAGYADSAFVGSASVIKKTDNIFLMMYTAGSNSASGGDVICSATIKQSPPVDALLVTKNLIVPGSFQVGVPANANGVSTANGQNDQDSISSKTNATHILTATTVISDYNQPYPSGIDPGVSIWVGASNGFRVMNSMANATLRNQGQIWLGQGASGNDFGLTFNTNSDNVLQLRDAYGTINISSGSGGTLTTNVSFNTDGSSAFKGVISGNGSGVTNATTSYFTNLVNGSTNVNTLTRTVQWTIPVAVSSPAATLGSAEIDAQIQRSDGPWITVADCDIAGGATSILATNKESLVITVPSGASMRVTNSTSGTGYVAGLDATKTNTFTVFP